MNNLRKALCTSFIILVFTYSSMFTSLSSAKPELPVRNTDTSLEYLTIQEAINARETLDGHAIFVNAGTYYENVIANKSISLIGHNKFDTIIRGQSQQNIITVIADNVKITGFTIEEGAYGYGGIHLYTSKNCNLTDNILRNCYYGLSLYGSAYNLAYDNFVSECEYGIRLYNSSNNIVTENTVSRNKNGIHFDISDNNIVYRNNVSLNLWNAVYLFESSNNTISDNTLSLNEICGTRLNNSNDNIFSNNTVTKNQHGFSLYESANNSIFYNTLSGNTDGIWLMGSIQNMIQANTVSNNSQFGLRLLGSSSNVVFHNNFANNSFKNIEQPTNTSLANLWDDFFEGNYWSNRSGNDTNKDGIDDNPYITDERTWLGIHSKDNHPLMGLFQLLDTQFQNQTYFIEIISNSTIGDAQYHHDSEGENTLILNLSSPENASFCRISISNTLVEPPYDITIDKHPPTYNNTIRTNGTHTWIYFEYNTTEPTVTMTLMHKATVIPQPPIWTQWPFWGALGLTALVAALSLFNIKSHKTINRQKELMRLYEEKLQRADPLIIAQELFKADVQTRKIKIEKFEEKYNVKIQPRNTFDDVIRSLRSKKKESEKTKN